MLALLQAHNAWKPDVGQQPELPYSELDNQSSSLAARMIGLLMAQHRCQGISNNAQIPFKDLN